MSAPVGFSAGGCRGVLTRATAEAELEATLRSALAVVAEGVI
ncbi:hypothetical protein ACFYO2_05625 [Streptomyces sp. NPDC006602]